MKSELHRHEIPKPCGHTGKSLYIKRLQQQEFYHFSARTYCIFSLDSARPDIPESPEKPGVSEFPERQYQGGENLSPSSDADTHAHAHAHADFALDTHTHPDEKKRKAEEMR